MNNLKNSNEQDPVTLERISKEIATKPLLQIPFLSYLINDLPINSLLTTLSCMSIMIGYLDDKVARLMIFSFCLKVRVQEKFYPNLVLMYIHE